MHACAQALQHALCHKPVLSWQERKELATDALNNAQWLRGTLDQVQFPWRSLDNPNQLEGAYVVARIVKARAALGEEGEEEPEEQVEGSAEVRRWGTSGVLAVCPDREEW